MRITIIGAGFTGTTLATELATSFDTDLDVHLVGVASNFGCGVAYGDARGEHLLNARAGQLGAFADKPADFAQWLNLSTRAHYAFLPRAAYGEYLLDRLHDAETTSTNLTTLEQEVIEIDSVPGGGYRIHLDDGVSFFSDRVVLAVGALPPQRLAGVGPRLARHWRYVASPWHEGDLERIDADARLLPLTRTMERTRNSVLQQRAQFRLWLSRGRAPGDQFAGGHIRWSKMAAGLSGRLGDFTARYAGPVAPRGHRVRVEDASGSLAIGYRTALGEELHPEIIIGNKSHARATIAGLLRQFAAALRFG